MLFALIFIAGCTSLLVLMFQWLRRQTAGPPAKLLFGGAVTCGALLGLWLSLGCEYQPGPRTRVAGAPLPLALFKLEDDHWTDIPPAYPILVALAALAGPVVLGFTLRRRSISPAKVP